jgi:hypothetical protein
MHARNKRRWRDLCEEAEAEIDPRKLKKLAKQILCILENEQNRANNLRSVEATCDVPGPTTEKRGIIFAEMGAKKLDELQRELESTLSKLKAEKEPGRRRLLLREMSRLLAEVDRILQTPK